MGNDISCRIVGIGSIKVKMYDGTMTTLTEVRHVPKLRNNLISMGVLDYVGYKFVVQGGVMKVYKGILFVMKEKRIKDLCKIDGSTEENRAAAVSEYVGNSSRLRHQPLGHMSKKRLTILVDRKLLPNLKSLNLKSHKHCLFGKQPREKFKT